VIGAIYARATARKLARRLSYWADQTHFAFIRSVHAAMQRETKQEAVSRHGCAGVCQDNRAVPAASAPRTAGLPLFLHLIQQHQREFRAVNPLDHALLFTSFKFRTDRG